MRREILTQLLREYEDRRRESDSIFFERLREVNEKLPEIGRLVDGRQELILSSIRGIIAGKPVGDVEGDMNRMNAQIREGLAANGYPEDYLEPVYQCPLCRDTGYVGEPIREMCTCLKTELNRRLYREAGMQESEEQSFRTFDLNVFPDDPIPNLNTSQRKMMEMIRDMTRDWARKWPDVREKKGILLTGASGLGKTFLLYCIMHELLERGIDAMMTSSFRAQDIMRRAYYSRDGQEEMDMLLKQDVLLIDDFGTEPLMDNVTLSQFFNLINERQSRQKACIFSTNLSPRDLQARYSERIASRLLDRRNMLIIEMRGVDVRRRTGDRA